MTERQITIDGMSCGHCVMAVKKELSKIEGVEVKDVQVGKAIILFDEAKVHESDLAAAISEAGYTVVS